ncbi:pentapeptide MXKDX repeat protein [Rhodanobacter sp. DHG33]|uniref:pentapeptide MXKDX repeat protein n=1 Tax=Rhodanobacter sp. DHG33 TaxID=2775921 RepID=UPI00177E6B45|nr:pentapeptide MXKDX repeat protein [Rhodanobacter sp. DHG33]MBD8898132.1 pentapeptide MXKDX repeat protein [Rhodanobacter sp. DHG33]
MNARTLAVLALSASIGAFAFAPVHAQDAMAASSSSAMPHKAMQPMDSMHKDGAAMKPGAMKMKKGDAMKMKKDDAMKMKKDDAMKSDAGGAMSGG